MEMALKEKFENKTVLVIGGTGTVGSKIVKTLLQYNPKVIRIMSRDEHKQFNMHNDLKEKDKLRFLIGDIRDFERLRRASRDVDIIFNLAAMKHVPAAEYDPFEAVKTNVMGTQNVIRCAVENNVKKVVFTSSDKAISPTNAMGATKLLAERLMVSANYNQGSDTVFSIVRFGNVMGSRGSVIPLLKKQILEDRYITITEGRMTRFMMSVTQAAQLTIKSICNSYGGEIFVLKMPVIRLQDLADVVKEEVCKKYNIPEKKVKQENIGLRPGEKMFEELMTKEESKYAYDLSDMYAILSPFYKLTFDAYKSYKKNGINQYSSENEKLMTKDEIRELIIKENLI